MNINKFNEFNKLNEEITYEELGLKTPTYEDDVRSYVVDILMEVNHISEKSFEEVNKISKKVKEIFNEVYDIKKIINSFENNGSRIRFTAEYIYDKFKDILL